MSLSIIPTALAISFMWGLQPVVHKYIMSVKHVDPKAVIFVGGISYTVAIVCFSGFFYNEVIRDVSQMNWVTIAMIATLSILTAFVANILYLYVLRDHSSFVVTSLMYSAPVFTLIMAILLLEEDVTCLSAIGGALMLMGVMFFALNEKRK